VSFLNLIRYKNLIFIGLTQLFIKYGFFNSIGIDVVLSGFQFALLVLATISIAAGGNVINDIYDVDADLINKPNKLIVGKNISEKNAYRIFITLNILGVFSGFLLSNTIGKPGFAALFIIISALLYMYASMLKGILLVGNILISVLIALSILIVGVFDVLPAIEASNVDGQIVAMKVITHYACFAFFINLIREIVKDIQDINGDKNDGLNTLPIAIGRKRATIVVFVLGILAVVAVVCYMYLFLYSSQILVLYFLLLVVAPLLYYCVQAYSAQTNKELSQISLVLKIIMFFGMCSISIYYLVLI
jgi:4-hydroxybenzoate polyprenyltransferase